MKFSAFAPFLLIPALVASEDPEVEMGEDGIPLYCHESFVMEVSGVTFSWQNAVGGTDILYDEEQIRWGEAFTSAGRSGMNAIANGGPDGWPKMLTTGNQFPLGELKHLNFPIHAGGGIDEVQLKIDVATSFGPFTFVYDLHVDETPNKAGTCPYPSTVDCSDAIMVINDPTPQSAVTNDGKTFEIDLLGFRHAPSSETVTEFISEEGGMNAAYLYGGLVLTMCPNGGGGMGDPHFETWNGHWFEFQGACDMHLVNAPSFAPGLPLTIDVRTRIQYMSWYSYIESIVIKIGEETLEVGSYGEYFINGVEGAYEGPTEIAGFPLTVKMPNKKTTIIEIDLDGAGEKIVIKNFKMMMNIHVANADEARFHGSSGLMGDYHTGQIYSRDGHTIMEDPEEIANEWQVRDTEPMLFQNAQAPQYPASCKMPRAKKPEQGEGRLGKTIALKAATEACAHWTGSTKEHCIADVMSTGDLEMAEAGF